MARPARKPLPQPQPASYLPATKKRHRHSTSEDAEGETDPEDGTVVVVASMIPASRPRPKKARCGAGAATIAPAPSSPFATQLLPDHRDEETVSALLSSQGPRAANASQAAFTWVDNTAHFPHFGAANDDDADDDDVQATNHGGVPTSNTNSAPLRQQRPVVFPSATPRSHNHPAPFATTTNTFSAAPHHHHHEYRFVPFTPPQQHPQQHTSSTQPVDPQFLMFDSASGRFERQLKALAAEQKKTKKKTAYEEEVLYEGRGTRKVADGAQGREFEKPLPPRSSKQRTMLLGVRIHPDPVPVVKKQGAEKK